jgi:hypothetical protein
VIHLPDNPTSPAIAAALGDLRRDVASVFPTSDAARPRWSLDIARSGTLAPETFVLEITADRGIHITGGGELGVVYGLYEFSHRFLGVDPLWFWKDIPPAPLADFAPAPQRIESGEPAFRYRGLFINDEDLLGLWRTPAGERFRDWPRRDATLADPPDEHHDNYEHRLLRYYAPVVAADTMEAFFEAALRLRCNLVIPASFIDILHEPEAAIVRAAVRRGLFVSQHHVEPLGVSHFAYETWCWKNGYAGAPFSYREAPATMRACWRAHAARWREVAGDRVIWQVGLRGRGDRPLWDHDPGARARAGEFVASALADQMAIVRSVDPRRAPPATLTLWLEGAELIASGRLRAPEGVAYVFADHHLTQELQEDFETLPREPGRAHGVYYHVAVWPCGPHLVQGPPPEKIVRVVRSLVRRGDTHYAILNVANLREHVMGAALWSAQVWRHEEVDTSAFLSAWASPELAPLYAELLDCFPELSPGRRLYDGGARVFVDQLVSFHAVGRPLAGVVAESLQRDPAPVIESAAIRLAALVEKLRATEPAVSSRLRAFFRANLLAQATILLGLYRAVLHLLPERADFAVALAALESALAARPLAEEGRWAGWYRGDTKMDLARLRARIAALAIVRPA